MVVRESAGAGAGGGKDIEVEVEIEVKGAVEVEVEVEVDVDVDVDVDVETKDRGDGVTPVGGGLAGGRAAWCRYRKTDVSRPHTSISELERHSTAVGCIDDAKWGWICARR